MLMFVIDSMLVDYLCVWHRVEGRTSTDVINIFKMT